jgi:DNA invertase Pin-like site-specific DNA recombinase
MKIGYARVSRKKQNLSMQLHALRLDGCEKIFREKKSGVKQRPQLDIALASLRRGDTLVVWHLDRLGRDARELINLGYQLKRQGIELRSLTQNLDTTTPEGEYEFIMTCAQAQLERSRIARRTKAGLIEARRRGVKLGRPRSLSDRQVERARKLIERPDLCRADIAARFKVGRVTLWRALQAA